MRRLDVDGADEAMHSPEQFRGNGTEAVDLGGLELGPYETVRIDT